MLSWGRAPEFAIRATLYLALQPPGKLSPVHEVAHGTGLPQPYLAKIMGRLVAARLVRAFRGPGGGMELGRPPETITLWSLVQAMPVPAEPEPCLLGLRSCSADNSCPLHGQWAELRAAIRRLLQETTLASVAKGLREKNELGPELWVGMGSLGDERQPWNGGSQEVAGRPAKGPG